MARDVVIRWQGQGPTQEQLTCVVEDFFAGIATKTAWDADRFFVTLPGPTHGAFSRLPDLEVIRMPSDERWIEVWPSDDCLYVMTRMMDEVTNVLADGFAELLARVWDGHIEG